MTMAQAIPLTHCVDASLIARLFARFRGRYGNLWTSRATCDEDWEFIMDDWLQELSRFNVAQVRGAVNKTLTEFKEFPPTLGQLVDLCMKESGVPSQQEVIRLMVARDFRHPLVKMVYDKIGSWTLTNGKSDEIERKVKEYYSEARSIFHVEPQKAWEQLESFNAKPKELPAPDKIPSASESKAFKECMAKCQEMLKSKTALAGGKTYKHYDENKIKIGNKEFDKEIHNEYCEYLLSIPETDTLILPIHYIYERTRLIGQRDQKEYLEKAGYIPRSQRDANEQTKPGSGKPTRIYKSWHGD